MRVSKGGLVSGRHTLGLNMIVGPGEGPELERCLDGLRASEVFDEIVIGRTTHDEAVKKVADKYGASSFYHQWRTDRYPYGNFSEARNAVLDRTTTDFVWWADADDSFMGDKEDTILRVRDVVTMENTQKNIEVWFMEYATTIDQNMQTICSVWRDRIFRRNGKFRWRNAVHELVGDNWEHKVKGNLYGAKMIHLPTKPNFSSAYRNVLILENEIANGDRTSRTRFFLARDMMMLGRIEEAVEIFEQQISTMRDQPSCLYSACIEMAFYFAYGCPKTRTTVTDMNLNNADKIERYLRLALAFSTSGAEPYVMLGDLYITQKHYDAAHRCYAAALEKKMKNGMMQIAPYYDETPSWRLADYYMARNDYESALLFNRRARRHNGTDLLRQQRFAILDKLCRDEGILWVPEPQSVQN